MHGTKQISAERVRQIYTEGYTRDKDAGHEAELARAAQAYLGVALRMMRNESNIDPLDVPIMWPWDIQYWNPSNDQKRNLVKAGALIAAAIDAIDGGNV